MIEKEESLRKSRLAPLLLAISLSACVHWVILGLGIPVLDNLPYWKYKLRFTPADPVWIMAAFIAFGAAVGAYFSRLGTGIKLAALVLLGAAIQYSFAFSKGHGLDGIRDRMVSFGHAEFAKAAVEQPGDMLWVARHYEEVAAKKKYGYIGSKPPGTFLFYMASEALSRAVTPASDHVERLENLRTFASLTWTPLSYLVIVPLYFLAREITKEPHAALLSGVFYLCVPSVTLITLHTDQVVYPLLSVLSVLTGFLAYREGHFWLAVLCGASLYFAVYFSFGLAVVGLLLLAPVLNSPSEGNAASLRLAKYWGGILLGAFLLHILAAFFLEYDIVTRYANAWTNHLAWKGWQNDLDTFIRAGFTNTVEFSVWAGLPLTILFLAGAYRAFRSFPARAIGLSTFFTVLLAGIFIFLLVFGKTKAEVARLWLFLVPFICIAASDFIHRRNWSGRDKFVFTVTVLLLEMGTTFFTLRYQDFS